MKKILPLSLMVILFLALALTGCGPSGGGRKGSGTTPPTLSYEVYVGGYYINDDGTSIACYWDPDGTKYDLGDGSSDSKVLWLSFYNDELYAVGYYEYGNKQVPCYWINTNTVPQELVNPDDLDNNAEVLCGYIYNGQVYAGGHYFEGANLIPCYWDQTKQYDLDTSGGSVTSIFVNVDGVYVAVSGSLWARCWLNNETEIDNFDGDVAHILVDNSRIYMGGSLGHNQEAFYRVKAKTGGDPNDQPLEGDKPAKALSLFVQGNQVYAGGYYSHETLGKSIACYWDGDEKHDLESDGDKSEAKSIFVYGNQVYTAGFVGKNACYWIGTKRYKLDNEESGATCILVR